MRDIHDAVLDVGADIIETNTFNATAISQADYGTQDLAYEINREAARIAREAADGFTGRTPEKPRFVAGAIGPTNRTASLSPDVNNPGMRNTTFDELKQAYNEAARGLVDGGADLLLVETIFDTLNAKAAIFGIKELLDEEGIDVPIMISGTITDASGRTLSGQVTEAFWNSVRHAEPVSVGLNCALGSKELRQYVEELSRVADVPVSAYPNAGLPNEFGEYDETPEMMAAEVGDWAREGWLNIVGGCCGTTPEHVEAIAEAVSEHSPREVPEVARLTRLSGLEPCNIGPESLFVNVGERTNVTGSRRFKDLILEGDYETALEVARGQVENGAQMIDVNMDEGMLEGEEAMVRFLNLVAGEPDISRVPVMIDSSRWSIIEAGLKCVQGKPVVNSISLKEGEEEFVRQARLLRRYGAAVIVMAFDETGQADTRDRKVAICARAYRVLTEKVGFPPEDIIFDPNVFAVATGIEEHNNYGVDFIEAVREISRTLPHARTSGGISNVSFSFRGNDTVREAIHAVFLYHAIRAGLTMGIVNAGQLAVYDEIDGELREAVEDVVLNRRDDSTERLLALAEEYRGRDETCPTGRGTGVAVLARGEAPRARASEGHRRVRRGGHGGSAAQLRPANRGDRGSPHGRDGRGRGPVRVGQDVPAAGGQERARHEEGGGVPDTVYRGGEGRGPQAERHHRDGHRQGRRARHREEHRRGGAAVQQLRGRRPRGHGAEHQDPRGRKREGRRRHRALRPDHALPRRDGAQREGAATRGIRDPAPDRGRDDLPDAHGGEDSAQLRRCPRST